ncbi:uncharacterized protein LOC135817350 [Sycon ciliatum]|uniref:uncharacterized protein LOC135817350 n=1 Tax=Sycon ciliatum TaxID=27933 RepID=UPI0031F704A4
MEEVRKEILQWYEILALQFREKELQRVLHADVMLVFDHLVNAGVFEGTREYVEIKQHSTQYQQVSEILRLLVAKKTSDSFQSENVFDAFCKAVLAVEQPAMAEMLQKERERCIAEECEETASKCDLARPRIPYTAAMAWIENAILKGRYHGDKSPIERYKIHLKKQCEVQSRHASMAPTQESVEDTFVSMTAMTEREALRLSVQRSKGNRAQPGPSASEFLADLADDSKCSFELHNPLQLLMKDPKSDAQPARSASSNSRGASSSGQKVKLLKRCMLMSGAGKGKTMAYRRVMADYSGDEHAPGLMQEHFDFVIPISCRDTDRVSTSEWTEFLGLDHHALDITSDEREEVLRYLSANSERVLLLLDGVDEGGKDAFQYTSAACQFMDETKKNRLVNASVVVTSRPCNKATDLVRQCAAYYRLTGFTDAQLRDFCCQQLGGAESAEKCLAELAQASRKHLKHAVQTTPLLAALLCQEFAVSEAVPPCTTSFYVQFMCSAVAELERKRGKQFSKVTLSQTPTSGHTYSGGFQAGDQLSVHDVITNGLEHHVQQGPAGSLCDGAELVQALCHLYRLSMERLLLGRAWFSSSEMQDDCLTLCKQLGFLVPVDNQSSASGSAGRRVAFLHLTIQEFCAARSFVMQQSFVSNISQYISEIGVGEETQPFWRFVAGSIHTKLLPDLFKVMLAKSTHKSALQQRRFILFLMSCLLECSLSYNSSPVLSSSDDQCKDLVRSAVILLQTSHGVNLSGIHLNDSDISALCNVLSLFERVHLVNISNCNLSRDQITEIAPYLRQCVDVNLHGNNLSGASLEVFAAALSHSQHMQRDCTIAKLHISGACLTEQDAGSLSKLLHLPHLRTINVSANDLGNASLELLQTKITTPFLSMSNLCAEEIGLFTGCGTALSSLILSMPNLTILSLACNDLKDEDAACILSALQHNHSIQGIHLGSNLLTNGIASHIDNFLKARRVHTNTASADKAQARPNKLQQPCCMNLTGNDVDASLLKALEKAGHCGDDKIVIADWSITSGRTCQRDVKDIVAQYGGNLKAEVSNLTMESLGKFIAGDSSIRTLDLSSNAIKDDGVQALARQGLQFNSTLHSVDFYRNSISISGAAAIVASSTQGKLQLLSLTKNPVFKDGVTDVDSTRTFMSSLPLCCDLQYVSMGDTGMTDAIAEDLLTALTGHENLQVLFLDRNELGDNTVKKLVDMKRTTSSLKMVSLVKNQITGDGIRCILSSTNMMSMDRIWVGGNLKDISVPPPLTNHKETLSYDFFEAFLW